MLLFVLHTTARIFFTNVWGATSDVARILCLWLEAETRVCFGDVPDEGFG